MTIPLTLNKSLAIALLGLGLAIFFGGPVVAQQAIEIQSAEFQHTREAIVHLPKKYDPNHEEGYAVLYILDAGPVDRMTAELADALFIAEILPEVIVVGLKNVDRGPDFLPHYYSFTRDGVEKPGNGGKLLSYIEKELITSAYY